MNKHIIAYRNIILGFLGKFLPLNSDLFYYCSFHGQYNDSPRYLSEALHQKFPKATMVWEITDKCNEIIPNYVIAVCPNSVRAVWLRCRSCLIVDNYMGWYYGYANKGSLRYLIFHALKKQKQFNLCTWHGTALKKINLDEPSQKAYNDFYTSADLLACGNHYMEQLYKRINYNRIPIIMSGMPRNDMLFQDRAKIRMKLCNKLGLPTDKKILLYAPTFRNNIEWSGFQQMNELDFTYLLSKFSKCFGGNWIFVFRLHDSVLQRTDMNKVLEKGNGILYSGNIGDDMAEYLVVSDALLTDYSSSFFDYILTKRPCFLYCPDRKKYGDVERGFYMDLDKLPFSISETPDELYRNIDMFSIEEYMQKNNKFLKKIGNIENGTATAILVNIICQQLKNRKKGNVDETHHYIWNL